MIGVIRGGLVVLVKSPRSRGLMRKAGARRAGLKVEASSLDFFAEGDFHDVEVALLFREADFGKKPSVGRRAGAERAGEFVEGLGGDDVGVGGLGRRPVEDMAALLVRLDNADTSPPAPPEGLYFVSAEYPAEAFADHPGDAA